MISSFTAKYHYWRSLNPEGKKVLNKSTSCFRQFFDEAEQDLCIEITYYLVDLNIITNPGPYFPCCIVSEEIMCRHIDEAKKFLDFTYEYTKANTSLDGVQEIKLLVHFPKCKKILRNYVLTWIKYVFEYPMTCWVHDIWKLKEIYPDMTAENLSLIISGSCVYWNSNHTVQSMYSGPVLTTEQLKVAICNNDRLNNIYLEAPYRRAPGINPVNFKPEERKFSKDFNVRLKNYQSFIEFNKIKS